MSQRETVQLEESDVLTKSFFLNQMQLINERFDRMEKRFDEKLLFWRQDLRDQMHSIEKGLNQKIDALDHKLNCKMDSIYNELKKEIHVTQLAVRSTRDDLKNSEQRLDAKIDGVERRLDGVEKRLSEKLDWIGAKVMSHDQAIALLNQTLGNA